MKVAIIEPVGGHGGMDYYDFGLCEGLAKADVEVTLYTCDETGPQPTGAFEVKRWFHGIYGKRSIWLRASRFAVATIRILMDVVCSGQKVVHFHFFQAGVSEFGLVFFARLLRRKVVVTVHDVEAFVAGKQKNAVARNAYRLAHVIIVHNDTSRDELVNRIKTPKRKIAVIPHGNYMRSYGSLPSREEARAYFGIDEMAAVLLFFGQIKKVKGLDILLGAMPEVVAGYPEVLLVIAGKEVDVPFARYREVIEQYGFSDHSRCDILHIANDLVPYYFRAADLAVLPYRRIYQSGVVLMAMSWGVPVLVSDIPGMLEVVTDGETGFVFRDGDSKHLARVIKRALSDSKLLQARGVRGRAHMERGYAWDDIGLRTAMFYRGLEASGCAHG